MEERCTARLQNGLKKPTGTGMMLSSLFFPGRLIPHHLHLQSHPCGVKHTTWFGSSETQRNGIEKEKKTQNSVSLSAAEDAPSSLIDISH